MKLRSAPLDDIWGELQFALDDDGGRRARLVRTVFTAIYRALHTAMRTALRTSWRRGALDRQGCP